MELCTRENAVFFLPVNILMVWHVSFLGQMKQYCVSMIVMYDFFRQQVEQDL